MTSTLQLTRYDGESGIEILINSITGESFCSVKGYARMSGISKSVITRRLREVTETSQGGPQNEHSTTQALDDGGLQRGPQNDRITAQVMTISGLQSVRLITEEQIVEWLPNDNPVMASKLLRMGVRIALHGMAGYSVTTTATAPTPIVADSLEHLRDTASIALALAGTPGVLAIETFKMLNNLTTPPTPASPEPKPTKAKSPKATPTPTPVVLPKADQEAEARELVKSFMRDVETLVSAGVLGLWDVADVKQNFKPCTAIVLQSVIPLLEAHFNYQIDRARLEAAIVTIGGKSGQNQRFLPKSPADRNKGHRSIVRKCSVIPDGWV